jgi:hypothetical protein
MSKQPDETVLAIVTVLIALWGDSKLNLEGISNFPEERIWFSGKTRRSLQTLP